MRPVLRDGDARSNLGLVGQETGFKLMRVDLTADDADIHAELSS